MPRNNSRARKEQRQAAAKVRAKLTEKKTPLEREKNRGHPQRFNAYIEQFVEHSKR